MEKYFKLPKEFTEKWLKALRSGEYIQGSGSLVTLDKNNNTSYCCLGVACVITKNDIDIEILGKASFISENYLDDEVLEQLEEGFLPGELFGENKLTLLLAGLNDGTALFNAKSRLPGFKFPEDKIKDDIIEYSFEEIADLIEQIVETY